MLKKGEVFDTDNLINERDRISKYLRNRGFYSFNKEFIYFDLDSNNRSKKINLNLGIQNYKKFSQAELPITDLTVNPKKDSTQSPDLFLKKIMSRLPR